MEYRHFGVMLDCSRNAVMKPSEVCRFIDHLVLMGYNTLELYTEDTFELPGEPYFGYLRGRYTKEEIQFIDAYARDKGVELIPCIQTLAHNTNITRYPRYAEILDTGDILLCGEEKTYAFLDKVFATVADYFTSRRINIGMDEAHSVGLGQYLSLHGYEDRAKILEKHLCRVAGIAAKYGFQAHMWSDMIFHLTRENERFEVPENVGLVYWDYYQKSYECYDGQLTRHEPFGREVWFAGGAWSWSGFAPYNQYSLPRMLPAMQAVRAHQVRDVLITMWGDNGAECSFYSLLPTLYAIRRFADGEENMDTIKADFRTLFGQDFDAFLTLDAANYLPGASYEDTMQSPSKMLLFNDPFMGVFDADAAKYPAIPYAEYADRMGAYRDMPEYGYLFDTIEKLCRVLEKKYDLGIRTRAAYLAGDREALRRIADTDYPVILERLDLFYHAFRRQWMKERKPFGMEIHDARLGGLMQRLRVCRETLYDYLDGKIDSIPELEQTMLPFSCCGDCIHGWYTGAISTSYIG